MPAAALQTILDGRFADVMQFREKPARESLPSGIPALDLPCGASPKSTVRPHPDAPRCCSLSWRKPPRAKSSAPWWMWTTHSIPLPPPPRALRSTVFYGSAAAAKPDRALKVTDLVVQGGGFGLVVMDLGNTPPETARRIPPASWFRFRHAVQNTRSVLLVLEQGPYARSCAALSLEARREAVTWSGSAGCSQLLRGMQLQVEQRKPRAGTTFAFCPLPFAF